VTQTTTPKASPALLERIDRLTGCQGNWLLIRDGEPEHDCSHQWHQSPEAHLATCLQERWRGVSLGFCPTYCGWSDYSSTGLVGKANYNVLTDSASTPDPHGGILTVGCGWNGSGVVLDLLRVPADVLESVEALECYPLISGDEHSTLELEEQERAWEDHYSREWLECLTSKLQEFAPDEASAYWAEEHLETVPELEHKLLELFRQACDDTNTYWVVEDLSCGAYIDLERVAAAVGRHELEDLSGLQLLAADQLWRHQPYPWAGAEPAPLLGPLQA
jgi:hypothetical protein